MSYLRQIFNDVDKDHSGRISFAELHEALKRGQSSSEFDLKTVRLFIEKYDKNGDGDIDFNEFQELFNYLNSEFERFLTIDLDGSGTVDAHELATALKNNFNIKSDQVSNYIVNTIRSHYPNGITFDLFCRVMVRFSYLHHQYNTIQYYQKGSFEDYLKKTFFTQFL
jgi:Ca2+-binding EF-hand superfamily protein